MPLQLASRRIVGLNEPAHAGVSSRGADDNVSVHNERGTRTAVMFRLVRVLNFPTQIARTGVEAKQVGIVSFRKDKVVPQRHPAALVRGRIVQQSCTDFPVVMPQLASRLRIQRESVVSRRKIHDTVNDYGRSFKSLRISGMENPGSTQPMNIRGIDF